MTHLLKSGMTAQYLQDKLYLYLLWICETCVGVSMFKCIGTHMCAFVFMWRSEVGVGCLAQSLSTFYIEVSLY